MEIRAAYGYDVDKASFEAETSTPGECLVQQSQRDEADINVIVKRFGVTGMLPQRTLPPMFGDFTGVKDFREAQDRILEAKAAFNALPAEVRRRFDDDPAAFVEFATNEANIDELRKMGLAKPKEPEAAPAVGGSAVGTAPAGGASAPPAG